jgi:hypothetical protein
MDPLIKVYNLSIFCYNWELAQADFKLLNKKYKHFVLVTAGFESYNWELAQADFKLA